MKMDLVQIQKKLEAAGGRRLWRSLEELAETPEYRKAIEAEFPQGAFRGDAGKEDQPGRRDVLKLLAASAALCGFSGCVKMPAEKIMPYVKAPEEIIPGKPLFYATSMPDRGSATGVLVETHTGRPTKIEGNPSHPASLGATSIFAQASVFTFWSPLRSQTVLREGRISDYGLLASALRELAGSGLGSKGSGLRVLTGAVCSPAFEAGMEELLRRFPEAKWHVDEPFGPGNEIAGARMAFGREVNCVYRFDRADIVFSLDSDFLYTGPAAVRYGRDFMQRRVRDLPRGMNRLYAVEPAITNTGALADHRYPVRMCEVEAVARALASAVGIEVRQWESPVPKELMAAAAADLISHGGRSLVIAGPDQPAPVHALAHLINERLGNSGSTVYYTAPLGTSGARGSLAELAREMENGQVRVLLIIESNPVFTAPADLDFGAKLKLVPVRIHSGLVVDETAELCNWHVPQAHYLEAWGDARSFDGTTGIIQPVIAPLYDSHPAEELLGLFTADSRSQYERVRSYWRKRRGGDNEKQFQDYWETALHEGVLAGTKYPELAVRVRGEVISEINAAGPPSRQGIELVFRPDPTIWDGRWASNLWLQELPKPITKITWDNALHMSPAMAARLGLGPEDLVEITAGGRTVTAPVWVMPGHADQCATLTAGYGQRGGRGGGGAGFNTYPVRTSEALHWSSGVQIRKMGGTYKLASAQIQHLIAAPEAGQNAGEAPFERALVKAATLEEFQRNPGFAAPEDPRLRQWYSLAPRYRYEGYAWAMAIDLNRCIGCSACVIACYAENNIPVVGKSEVLKGRDMQWIRVDTYYRGRLENPEVYFEPLPCMHCENAPCELVCPVGATMHSAEGLNEMIYNRCVGTRYCSNNCPYKVRRFNFRLYSDWTTGSLYGLRNPNVTVRSRGVMEKCTYCVQRINAAKIEAEKEERSVRDGEIRTACQQACPTDAIIFGDLNDPKSLVSRRKSSPRDYPLLGELNTRPRTTYQAKLTNPSPQLSGLQFRPGSGA